MTTKYRAASTVLNGVWFAVQFCNDKADTIDWPGIAEFMNTIVPTENEKKLVEIANEIWNGTGEFIDIFGDLDHTNRQNLVNGIKILLRE